MNIIKIGDCSIVLQGRNIDKKFCNNDKKGLPYIVGASCLKDSGLVCERYTEYPQKSEISRLGDVIISTVGTLGKIAVNNIGDCVLSNHVCAVRFVPEILPEYGMICLMAAISDCIPPDDGTKTGFSKRLEISAIENLPLTLVGINQQRLTVEKMLALGRELSCMNNKISADIKQLPDDPIELIELFEAKVKLNLKRQRKALKNLVDIMKSDWNEKSEQMQLTLL